MATGFGVFTGAFGLVTAPFFLYSTALGLKAYWEGPPTFPFDNHVRVHLGASRRADLFQGDGHQPGAVLWGEDGTFIGQKKGSRKRYPEASHIDLLIKSKKGQENRPGQYLALSAGGDDAICIPAIEIAHPDGSKSSINGNMIVGCGEASWYPSNKAFGADNDRPNCFWLDTDRSNGLPHQGISIHLPDIKGTQSRLRQYSTNIDTWCKSFPRLSMHKNLKVGDNIPIFWPKLEYNPDGTDKRLDEVLYPHTIMSSGKRRRDAIPGEDEAEDEDFEEWITGNNGTETAAFHPVTLETINADIDELNAVKEADEFLEAIPEDDTAPIRGNKRDNGRAPRVLARAALHPRDLRHHVRSHHPEHSAAGLCSADNSWGPSFTNPAEGLHCDMETKTLYPLCAEGVTEACFDNDEHEIREPAPLGDAEVDESGKPKVALGGSPGAFAMPKVGALPIVLKKYDDVLDWE